MSEAQTRLESAAGELASVEHLSTSEGHSDHGLGVREGAGKGRVLPCTAQTVSFLLGTHTFASYSIPISKTRLLSAAGTSAATRFSSPTTCGTAPAGGPAFDALTRAADESATVLGMRADDCRMDGTREIALEAASTAVETACFASSAAGPRVAEVIAREA